MMRYVVAVNVSRSPDARNTLEAIQHRFHQASPLWKRTSWGAAVQVFWIEEPLQSYKCHILSGDRGVILGTLFERTDGIDPQYRRSHLLLDESESNRIVSSGGKHLVEHYWGSYVAFYSGVPRDSVRVLRSPMGLLPCLAAESRELHFYFSNLADLLALGIVRPTINWRFVGAHLAGLAAHDETGLNEIGRIDGGECIAVSGGSLSREHLWDPAAIARSLPITDADQAIRAVRLTTKACVHAWASCFDSVILALSGGLDSSIVLGCLKDAPTRPGITAVNSYSQASDNDERVFARKAAERAGCKLLEMERNLEFDINGVFESLPTERPHPYVNELAQRHATLQLLERQSAQAVFSGDGGDEVYLNGAAKLAVADLLRTTPLSRRVWPAVWSAAWLESVSVWRVLFDAFFVSAPGQRNLHNILQGTEVSPLLNLELVRSLLDDAQPRRYGIAAGLLPGKRTQLYRLLRHSSSICFPCFRAPGDPQGASPLLSQPLIEICLRIPTYLLISRGWDRAIARQAFVLDVPEEILSRRWKGSQENFTETLIKRHRIFMRELLLDGVLSREGLLDREKVDRALSPIPCDVLPGTHPLSRHLSLEIWLRNLQRHGAYVGGIRPVGSSDMPVPLLSG
jgi:asparagine synthase (glutamine-hydrolysing)